MLAHQGLKQDLIDLVVRAPVIADYMVRHGFNILFVQIIVRPLVLNIRVRIGD